MVLKGAVVLTVESLNVFFVDKIATSSRLDTHNKLQSADRAICCSNFGFRRAKWGCCRFLQIRRAVTVLPYNLAMVTVREGFHKKKRQIIHIFS